MLVVDGGNGNGGSSGLGPAGSSNAAADGSSRDGDSSISIYGNAHKGADFAESLGSGSFLFAMVMSYTATCEVPGLSVAGADTASFKLTPPADAEYLHYGYCKTIRGIPVTPDGKPTPAVMTKAALESASIPHMVVSAGSRVAPQLPYIETGLAHGANIRVHDAMTIADVVRAVDHGRIVGRSLAPLADCLVIGESIPAGTTTAMAVLYGLGFHMRVSSSMPENPIGLKEDVVCDAFARMAAKGQRSSRPREPHGGYGGSDGDGGLRDSSGGDAAHSGDQRRPSGVSYEIGRGANRGGDAAGAGDGGGSGGSDAQLPARSSALLAGVVPRPPEFGPDPAERQQYLNEIVAAVGDPMIPFVAGMLSSASVSSKVMLAGGTQMAAVLAFASGLGYDDSNVAVGTTVYVAEDPSADFARLISSVADVPALAVDPGLDSSAHAGLRAFAHGYAKEGVGAGGCMISSMLKTGMRRADMARAIDSEYARLQ